LLRILSVISPQATAGLAHGRDLKFSSKCHTDIKEISSDRSSAVQQVFQGHIFRECCDKLFI